MLRGVAALGVFASHWRDLFFPDYTHTYNPLKIAFYLFTGLGHEWVIVFFVLSGYLVGGSVLRATQWKWGKYLFARFTRLYIVLIPALVLGAVFDAAGIHLFGISGLYGGHSTVHSLQFSTAERLTKTVFAGNLFFFQTILVPTFGSNGPLWSLANEFWYYIMFPLLVLGIRKRNALYLLGLLCVAAFAGKGILFLGIAWLMGVAIHFVPKVSFAGAEFLAILFLATTLVSAKIYHVRFSDLVIGSSVMVFIYFFSSSETDSKYSSFAHFLSRSSYTLYLVHVPALVFIAAWLHHSMIVSVIAFIGVFGYAQAVWYFCERHTDTLRKWISSIASRGSERILIGKHGDSL